VTLIVKLSDELEPNMIKTFRAKRRSIRMSRISVCHPYTGHVPSSVTAGTVNSASSHAPTCKNGREESMAVSYQKVGGTGSVSSSMPL
jgi:hypothetical protein